MKLGIKTTDGVSKLKTKTTDGVAKAVECACCNIPFSISLQTKFAEGEGNMVGAYVGLTDSTTFFGGMRSAISTNSDINYTGCFGEENFSFGHTTNYDGSSTLSIVTENHSTFLRKQSQGQYTNSTYSSYSPSTNTSGTFDNDTLFIESCPGDPAFTCTITNTLLKRVYDGSYVQVDCCGDPCDESSTYSVSANDSRSRTLINPLPQELAEEWARANFEAFPSPPFDDSMPLIDSGSAFLVASGNSGPLTPYVRIFGSKEYRLLFPASRSPDGLYGPSPTGYLKVWLQKTVTIERAAAGQWPPNTQSTTSETTFVFTGKISKSQLIADAFYPSDTYPVDINFMGEPIQNPSFASQGGRLDIGVIGYTFDANYTGTTPP